MLWRTPELDSLPDDIIMHHDKKVGLGLGILLVGIVGAFFFREEPGSREPLPELQTAEMLDREISESLVDKPKPYTDLERYEQKYQPSVDLQGIETAGSDEKSPNLSSSGETVFDEEFSFLNEPAEPITDRPPVAVNSEQAELSQESEKQTSRNPRDFSVSSIDLGEESSFRMFTSGLGTGAAEPLAEPFAEDQVPSEAETTADSPEARPEKSRAAENQPTVYVVQEGDTLSEIASRLLGRQNYFRKIFELNRDQLASPDDLRPGMRLIIPTREQLRQSEEVSLIEKTDLLDEKDTRDDREDSEPPDTGQNRRVIIPRRVRLNEPIATRPDDKPTNEPRARFQVDDSDMESNDDLPTLEGLEPLDLPR